MKIVFIIPNIYPSGPVNVVYNIAKSLGSKHELTILTFHDRSEEDLTVKFENLGVQVLNIKSSWLLSFFPFLNRHLKILNKINPDIVNVHGLRPTILAMFTKYKTISTIHSCVLADFTFEYGSLISKLSWSLYKYALNNITGIISVSKSVGNFLKSEGINSFVIENGIDTLKWRPPTKNERKNARGIYCPSESLVIAVVGRLIERKNVSFLLRALTALDTDIQIEIFIAGEGPQKSKLEIESNNIKSKNIKINFIGEIADVRKLYWASDILVSCSKSEGAPMAILEAVSSGIPVCLSNIDSHREIISHNEKLGRLFDINSISDFHRQFLILASQPIKSTKYNPIARTCYDSNIAALKYIECFEASIKYN